ncbi:hypothetical protein J6590_009067 [Homalodisca vitripennis]|nr:hypothetical protein J6590_009067 [Homalodisca vitripennis]
MHQWLDSLSRTPRPLRDWTCCEAGHYTTVGHKEGRVPGALRDTSRRSMVGDTRGTYKLSRGRLVGARAPDDTWTCRLPRRPAPVSGDGPKKS